MHEYIKVKVAVDIVDANLADNIFPRTSVGAQYSNLVTVELLVITKLPSSKEQKMLKPPRHSR